MAAASDRPGDPVSVFWAAGLAEVGLDFLISGCGFANVRPTFRPMAVFDSTSNAIFRLPVVDCRSRNSISARVTSILRFEAERNVMSCGHVIAPIPGQGTGNECKLLKSAG